MIVLINLYFYLYLQLPVNNMANLYVLKIIISFIIKLMLPVKKKLEHISYGITKNQANYQIGMIQLMNKLIDQTRQNNQLLRKLVDDPDRKQGKVSNERTNNSKKNIPANSFEPANTKTLLKYKRSQSKNQPQTKTEQQHESQKNSRVGDINEEQEEETMHGEDDFRRVLFGFQEVLTQVSKINQKIYEKLDDLNKNQTSQHLLSPIAMHNNEAQKYQRALLEVLDKRQKNEKKTYNHYGILSQIMPFSDKRQIKVRYKIVDLMEKSEIQKLNLKQFKQNTTEWVGMIFRATASICWNMLSGGQLNFDEIKVLFTQNIIFNFIEYMKDIRSFVNQEFKLQLTNHINDVSCQVLQFLCRQYPQTKIEAPNIALRKAIPKIQNQGQSKFDLVAMMCKKTLQLQDDELIEFKLRTDKDYSSAIMKSINYMIEQTQSQYPQFQRIMTNIFEKIYLPKDKRAELNPAQPINFADGVDSHYRQKVKNYSSYLIGRKIPKNTPKYSKNEIQYGVFFVKAPSILRIITKWFEQLWELVNTSLQKLKVSTTEIKDHEGKVLNISTRVKHSIYLGVSQRLATIKKKIQRIKTECYDMQYLLADPKYTADQKQIHLSQDQLSVGKYCSNLKNAISSYVCTQLSKLMYYLLLIPLEIDEKGLNLNNEEFEEQARKHLDSVNLIYLKIFDLLRCKCHSNEEEIVFIVQALKRLDKQDPKFELIRVKDRLNQGTRDIMINAQYDGGVVWEIQLSVTSHVDKKQELLDKYNHFLYELKRSKLGPVSQCVSIWSSLQQRSIYFEQLYLKKKAKGTKCLIEHKQKTCKQGNYNESFSQFKRSIICASCNQYFAIPLTSLLFVRCENCRITYCGPCYASSLPQEEKERFIFQNFDKKSLLNRSAYDSLEEYTDYKKPIPKQGFFIKKKFLNRELSYYTLTKADKKSNSQFAVSISQAIIRGHELEIRGYNKKEIRVVEKGGQYFLQGSEKELDNSDLGDLWIYSFKNKKSQLITIDELESELKDPTKSRMKYLNVLFEPNYMNQLKLNSKIFEKMRLINNLRSVQNIDNYKIAVYRFPNLTVLAKVQVQQKTIQQLLVKKQNRSILKQYAQKMMSIVYMQESNLTDQINYLLTINSDSIRFYFMKVKKLYLADNYIEDITCFKEFKRLQSLSISKNQLKTLDGIQDLIQLNYAKFDQNKISSLVPLKKLVNLTYVSGNINQIQNLEGLSGLQNLGSLSLCQNKIVSLAELKPLGKLRRLYLRNNPITSIMSLKDNVIRHIYIGSTKINAMELSQMACINVIKEVSIKSLNLTAIPKIFDNCNKLTELKLARNNIKKIENLDRAVHLQRLDLSENEIEVMQNIQTLQNLQVLNLKSNKISKVECVKSFIQTLKVLQLQLNPLDSLTDYLMYEEKPIDEMRLKFTEASITAKAKEQLKNHSFELGNKSESDG